MSDTCRNCKFYFQPEKPAELTEIERAKLPNVGQCRVRAPTVGFVVLPKLVPNVREANHQFMPSLERGTAFPSVHDDVWCGEHQASA